MAFLLFKQHKYTQGLRTGICAYILQRRDFYEGEGWEKLLKALRTSQTLYVGNLSFYTTEEQIYELFSRVGPVKRVIMGLNKIAKTPCGFCFVEYYSHLEAEQAKLYLSGTKLDERVIRVELDPGFEEGRQYGRSRLTGGQVRDDHRADFDEGRGGWANAPQVVDPVTVKPPVVVQSPDGPILKEKVFSHFPHTSIRRKAVAPNFVSVQAASTFTGQPSGPPSKSDVSERPPKRIRSPGSSRDDKDRSSGDRDHRRRTDDDRDVSTSESVKDENDELLYQDRQ